MGSRKPNLGLAACFTLRSTSTWPPPLRTNLAVSTTICQGGGMGARCGEAGALTTLKQEESGLSTAWPRQRLTWYIGPSLDALNGNHVSPGHPFPLPPYVGPSSHIGPPSHSPGPPWSCLAGVRQRVGRHREGGRGGPRDRRACPGPPNQEALQRSGAHPQNTLPPMSHSFTWPGGLQGGQQPCT